MKNIVFMNIHLKVKLVKQIKLNIQILTEFNITKLQDSKELMKVLNIQKILHQVGLNKKFMIMLFVMIGVMVGF